MTLIEIIVVLIIIGVLLYLVEHFIPMDPAIKTVSGIVVELNRTRIEGRRPSFCLVFFVPLSCSSAPLG